MNDTVINESDDADLSRRQLLSHATLALGAIGAAFAAVPFVESWLPSERARAFGHPVNIDVSKVDPGQMVTVTWRRQPIYIVHRSPHMLARLGDHDADLKDPQSADSTQPRYVKNALRSRRADLFVTIGICTHLGCLPKARFEAGMPAMGATWPGGFLCPCQGSRFDLAGRVFKGSPASVNLVIPPYALAQQTLVIGLDNPGK